MELTSRISMMNNFRIWIEFVFNNVTISLDIYIGRNIEIMLKESPRNDKIRVKEKLIA